jgi:pimeloyl-ACP methyl ester carboxylesterase
LIQAALRLCAALLVAGLVSACANQKPPAERVEDPVTEAAQPAVPPEALVTLIGDPVHARSLVILVPGALTSYDAFGRYLAGDHRAGTAIMAFRFPGMDGRPRDGKVRIDEAGRQIAAEVADLPAAHVRLIGLSTGGPIVLEAARGIHRDRVEAALISTALPAPATLFSSAAAATDILAAASRAGSFRARPVWREYYRTLLFGRRHFSDPERAAESTRLADEMEDRLVLPGDGLARAHGGDLLRWRLTPPEELAHARILLLHGGEDPVFSARGARRLAERLRTSRILVYPVSGHLLFETEASLFEDIASVFRTWETG